LDKQATDKEIAGLAHELVLDVMRMMEEGYHEAEMKSELVEKGLSPQLAHDTVDNILGYWKSRVVRREGWKLLGQGLKYWGLCALCGLGGVVALTFVDRFAPGNFSYDPSSWKHTISFAGNAFANLAFLVGVLVAVFGSVQMLRRIWLVASGKLGDDTDIIWGPAFASHEEEPPAQSSP
jgi:hypothetical protein